MIIFMIDLPAYIHIHVYVLYIVYNLCSGIKQRQQPLSASTRAPCRSLVVRRQHRAHFCEVQTVRRASAALCAAACRRTWFSADIGAAAGIGVFGTAHREGFAAFPR